MASRSNLDAEFIIKARGLKRTREWKFKKKVRTRFERAVWGTRFHASRCLARVSYSNFTKNNTLPAHVKYLLRESSQKINRDSKPTFGTCDIITFKKRLDNEKRVFKIVLSPEEFFSMDIETFTHAFMNRLQSQAGRHGRGQYADWAAVVHTNTPHPHVHILIRGFGKDGNDFFIPRQTVSRIPQIANSVQEILSGLFPVTEELAHERRSASRFLQLKKLYNANLDEIIGEKASGRTWDEALNLVPVHRRQAMHARMVFFQEMAMLSVQKNGIITTIKNFDILHQFKADMLKRVVKKKQVKYSDTSTIVLKESKSSITGLITGIDFDSDMKSPYFILESIKGSACVIKVDDTSVERLRKIMESGKLLTVHGNRFRVNHGDTETILRKMNTHGRLLEAVQQGKLEIDFYLGNSKTALTKKIVIKRSDQIGDNGNSGR